MPALAPVTSATGRAGGVVDMRVPGVLFVAT
jgi:hypothetical protein